MTCDRVRPSAATRSSTNTPCRVDKCVRVWRMSGAGCLRSGRSSARPVCAYWTDPRNTSDTEQPRALDVASTHAPKSTGRFTSRRIGSVAGRRTTQAEYRRAFTPGRKPPLPVTLGGRSSRPPGALRRRRFFNLLPHLDTPPARTLSQSSVQENSRAQENRPQDALEAYDEVVYRFGKSESPRPFPSGLQAPS